MAFTVVAPLPTLLIVKLPPFRLMASSIVTVDAATTVGSAWFTKPAFRITLSALDVDVTVPPAAKTILPLAFSVSDAAAPAVFEIAAETVILPGSAPPALPVEIVTLVPPSKAVLISATSTLEPVAEAIKSGDTPASTVAPAVTVMLNGSINHVPAVPNTLDALTLPNACRLSCELVSTNPPLPVPAPLA